MRIQNSLRSWTLPMVRRCVLSGLAILVACLPTACAMRAAPKQRVSAEPADWSQVTRLPRGARLAVMSSAGGLLSGQFLRADAAHLAILQRDRETILDKAGVVTVVREERQGWRRAKRGFKFGAAAGGGFGLFSTGSAPWGAMLASTWGTIGFLIGAVDGANEIDRVLIYDVKSTGAAGKTGAGDVTRTRDLLITNQLLYQLSYAGLGGGNESVF